MTWASLEMPGRWPGIIVAPDPQHMPEAEPLQGPCLTQATAPWADSIRTGQTLLDTQESSRSLLPSMKGQPLLQKRTRVYLW